MALGGDKPLQPVVRRALMVIDGEFRWTHGVTVPKAEDLELETLGQLESLA